MFSPGHRCLALLLALLSGAAGAYEGGRREEADGGVHVPVLTRPPVLLHTVEAAYPPQAAAEGRTGSVELQLTLDAEGLVADAQVVGSAGEDFDAAALAAVRAFRFSPAEVDGVPAPVQLAYVYHFTLAPPAAPAAEPPAPPAAASATLSGTLLTRGSRTRVPGASVRCGDGEEASEALSDAQGRFALPVVAGECRVVVLADEHHPFETTETLAAGETAEVVYHLRPRAPGFETVVRAPREKKEVVRRTLERQELQRVPGSFGDPLRVLQNLPGVARAPFVSGALIVRGAAPDQTRTLLDGVDVPLLFHLGGGPSVLNADFLERVDFYPGGFSTRYGRAVGGMVDVATRKGASDTLHGSLKVDVLDSGFFVESPLGDGVSLAAAARRSYLDLLLPMVVPDDPEGGTTTVVPRYWDYQVRLDLGAGRGGTSGSGAGRSTYYLMAFGSDDLFKLVESGGGRNRDRLLDAHTLFHRLKGDWTYRRGALTSVLTPYAGYDLGRLILDDIRLRADVYSVGLREDVTLELSPALTLRTGTDARLERVQVEGVLPLQEGIDFRAFPGAAPRVELRTLESAPSALDAALYGELDVRAGPFTFTPGLRASASRVAGNELGALDPRLWVRARAGERTVVKASAGLFSQLPDTTEMDRGLFGTPTLRHERAFQTSLGVERQLTDALSVDLTGYFNRRYGVVVTPGRPVLHADGTQTREQWGNLGLGRAYGLELLVRHAVTRRFFGWVAYTLNRSLERRTDREEGYALSDTDQTHILTAVGSFRLPRGFELGVRMRYVSGRPVTPLNRAFDRFNSDTHNFLGSWGDTHSARMRSFQQLDVRLEKSWLFERWTFATYLDVQNVYDATNVEFTYYDYRFRRSFELPGIPVLPVVGVRGSF